MQSLCCVYCNEPLETPLQAANSLHGECYLRVMHGSLGAQCRTEDSQYSDPPGLTKRESAYVAAALVAFRLERQGRSIFDPSLIWALRVTDATVGEFADAAAAKLDEISPGRAKLILELAVIGANKGRVATGSSVRPLRAALGAGLVRAFSLATAATLKAKEPVA
jgi:hypothetical protein